MISSITAHSIKLPSKLSPSRITLNDNREVLLLQISLDEIILKAHHNTLTNLLHTLKVPLWADKCNHTLVCPNLASEINITIVDGLNIGIYNCLDRLLLFL